MCIRYPVDAFLGLLKFENIRSTCLCPTCEETRKHEKSKLQENIGNVNENIQLLQQVFNNIIHLQLTINILVRDLQEMYLKFTLNYCLGP